MKTPANVSSINPLDTEVDSIARYLINSPVTSNHIYELYAHSIESVPHASKNEEKLLSIAFKHPWLIPFFDSGLVFVRPYSELRRRIYTMFALLESTPEHADKFLAKKLGFGGVLYAIWAGIRDVFRTIVGIIILKVGRL